MRLLYVCTALILGGYALAGSAQPGSTSVKVAAGTQMSPVQAQEELLNLFEQEFMGVAKAMPADKYSFAPTTAGAAKFDGVRTFAQEVSHVTLANYYFASKILGEKIPVDGKAINAMTSKDDLLKAAAASFAYAHKAIASITPENAYVAVEGVDGLHTRS